MGEVRTIKGEEYKQFSQKLDVSNVLFDAQREELIEVVVLGRKSDGQLWVKASANK